MMPSVAALLVRVPKRMSASRFCLLLFSLILTPPECALCGTLPKRLHTVTLTPPLHASRYSDEYHENDSGQTRHYVMVAGKLRSYQVYASPNPNKRRRAAIFLLHGAGRTGVSLVDKWKSLANRYNLILIGPSTLGAGWNLRTDGSDFLREVLADAHKKYQFDNKRLYLFGHSSGGVAAVYFSILHSDTFAATAIHAGCLQAREHEKLIANARRKTPIVFINGTHDQQFPLPAVQRSANAFAQHGHDTEFIILQGHNHWYYDLAPYINDRAWEFMSRYKLPD
jgi:predicted esterase